jgi:hypothetical protein
MELTHGRLRATLIAGKIPVTEEAFVILKAGLTTIGHGYHIEKLVSEKPKTADLTSDFSRLHRACRTIVDVIDADQGGLGQIELILSDLGPGGRVLAVVEELRSLALPIETALAMLAQDKAIRKRRQNPETWFLLAAHDLFALIAGNPEPGVAGPLHRFTKYCAALIDARIAVPQSENSFRKRLTAALARRTGKIPVLPHIVFRGKNAS